jgi:hypothetical protein
MASKEERWRSTYNIYDAGSTRRNRPIEEGELTGSSPMEVENELRRLYKEKVQRDSSVRLEWTMAVRSPGGLTVNITLK